MKNRLDILNELYSTLGFKDGESLNLQGKRPTSGYMVSVRSLPVFDSVKEVNVHEVLKQLPEKLRTVEYIGVWRDSRTEKIHFDLSINIENYSMAIRIAYTFKQIAMYDVVKEETIYL